MLIKQSALLHTWKGSLPVRAAVTMADCPLDAALRQLASGLSVTKLLLYSSIA